MISPPFLVKGGRSRTRGRSDRGPVGRTQPAYLNKPAHEGTEEARQRSVRCTRNGMPPRHKVWARHCARLVQPTRGRCLGPTAGSPAHLVILQNGVRQPTPRLARHAAPAPAPNISESLANFRPRPPRPPGVTHQFCLPRCFLPTRTFVGQLIAGLPTPAAPLAAGACRSSSFGLHRAGSRAVRAGDDPERAAASASAPSVRPVLDLTCVRASAPRVRTRGDAPRRCRRRSRRCRTRRRRGPSTSGGCAASSAWSRGCASGRAIRRRLANVPCQEGCKGDAMPCVHRSAAHRKAPSAAMPHRAVAHGTPAQSIARRPVPPPA